MRPFVLTIAGRILWPIAAGKIDPVLIVVHNCLIHPLLPAADLLEKVRPDNRLSGAVYAAHDYTQVPGFG